jgi:hypothetical protein
MGVVGVGHRPVWHLQYMTGSSVSSDVDGKLLTLGYVRFASQQEWTAVKASVEGHMF